MWIPLSFTRLAIITTSYPAAAKYLRLPKSPTGYYVRGPGAGAYWYWAMNTPPSPFCRLVWLTAKAIRQLCRCTELIQPVSYRLIEIFKKPLITLKCGYFGHVGLQVLANIGTGLLGPSAREFGEREGNNG
jgi:hypothetical protein